MSDHPNDIVGRGYNPPPKNRKRPDKPPPRPPMRLYDKMGRPIQEHINEREMAQTCGNCRFSSWIRIDAWRNGKCGLMDGMPVKRIDPGCDSWETKEKEERDGKE